jgi:hypothetical protein
LIHRITEAVAHDDHTILIAWEDGVKARVDLASLLVRGEAFAPLRDTAYFVETMTVAERGLGLEWPNGVDFSADGLRARAFP